MGNSSSRIEKSRHRISAAIDRRLDQDNRRLGRQCKILLLGSGESGKSTIVKQMKLIHQNGYTAAEASAFLPSIHSNILESAMELIRAVKRLQFRWSDNDHERIAENLKFRIKSNASLSPDMATMISTLWRDPVAVKVMEHPESQLMDSAAYFFEHVERIAGPDYVPTDQDILRCRKQSTGISESRFTVENLNIQMLDVGGQRSERRKWIHCFEDVTSIIFCVSLSEYDQVLREDPTQNRMAESLALFESIVNSKWFRHTSIILFLNKVDVFKAKLARSPLERYFPEYTGGPDLKSATKFILWRFTQANHARLNIYPHVTQATDTSNIKLVFGAVRQTVLKNALQESGFM